MPAALRPSASRKGVSKAYLSQLAQQGLAALPELQALDAAGKADIAQVNKAYGYYTTGAATAAHTAGYNVYGPAIAAQQKLQAAEIRQSQALLHDVRALKNKVDVLTHHQTVIELDGRILLRSQSLQSAKLARR